MCVRLHIFNPQRHTATAESGAKKKKSIKRTFVCWALAAVSSLRLPHILPSHNIHTSLIYSYIYSYVKGWSSHMQRTHQEQQQYRHWNRFAALRVRLCSTVSDVAAEYPIVATVNTVLCSAEQHIAYRWLVISYFIFIYSMRRNWSREWNCKNGHARPFSFSHCLHSIGIQPDILIASLQFFYLTLSWWPIWIRSRERFYAIGFLTAWAWLCSCVKHTINFCHYVMYNDHQRHCRLCVRHGIWPGWSVMEPTLLSFHWKNKNKNPRTPFIIYLHHSTKYNVRMITEIQIQIVWELNSLKWKVRRATINSVLLGTATEDICIMYIHSMKLVQWAYGHFFFFSHTILCPFFLFFEFNRYATSRSLAVGSIQKTENLSKVHTIIIE